MITLIISNNFRFNISNCFEMEHRFKQQMHFRIFQSNFASKKKKKEKKNEKA